MKIRNIMFSGFAAAIFAGVCGAANAASVELISKPYADSNLQAKLTQAANAGDNIAISADGKISATGLVTSEEYSSFQTTNTAAIADAKKAGTDAADALEAYKTTNDAAVQKNAGDITTINNKISTMATSDAVSNLTERVTSAEGKITANEGDIADLKTADTELDGKITTNATAISDEATARATADQGLQSQITANKDAIDALDTTYVKDTDFEAFQTTNTQAIANAQAAAIAASDSKGSAAAAQSAAVEAAAADATSKANQALADAKTYSDNQDTAQSAAIKTAYEAADAETLATANKYTDDEIAELSESLTGTSTNLGTLTERVTTAEGKITATEGDIADLKAADTTLQQNIDAKVAQSDYDTKVEALEAKDTELAGDIADNAAAIQANATAIASKANSADVYTKGDVYTKSEVDTAIAAIEEYDDTALAGRVSANELAIATNTSGIATNAGAIEALQNAGYVSGVKTAGSYLVNFDASGNASYAPVAILDAAGAPIDLTTDAVK